jgi:cysteine synthase B
MSQYKTIESLIGKTPLVRLQQLGGDTSNTLLVKLEGDNPAGSVKDRAALSMINLAEQRGDISVGDTLIEATSGNTGIALAMSAAIRGYKMILVMPDTMSDERCASMKAYGAELLLVTKEQGGMEGARDIAEKMQAEGQGYLLDQFSNPDNYQAHIDSTGPEIWQDTNGEVTHFVSAMGTTGTITGVSIYLKQQNPEVQIVGVEPLGENENIPGIRRWTAEYVPAIFAKAQVDQKIDMTQREAEETMRLLATKEGIFCGVSAGGAVAAALRLSKTVENATIVTIIPDRGDRYISTGVFPV